MKIKTIKYKEEDGGVVELTLPKGAVLYTGRKDKNSIDIYENDIVKFKDMFYVVEWNNRTSGFRIYPLYLEEGMYTIEGKKHESSLSMSKKFQDNAEYEVVGNVNNNYHQYATL